VDDFKKAQSMIELFNSYIPTRVIYVAVKLGLADHIGDDGAMAQDLAAELNVHPDALYRLMRVLAGLGVLLQDDHDRFFVTPFGDTLRKNSPQSVRDYAIYSHESTYERVGKMLDSIRTGEPAVENYFAGLRALSRKNKRNFSPAAATNRVSKPRLLSRRMIFLDVAGSLMLAAAMARFCPVCLTPGSKSRRYFSIKARRSKRPRQVTAGRCRAVNLSRETFLTLCHRAVIRIF
jgi:hypothetical protein